MMAEVDTLFTYKCLLSVKTQSTKHINNDIHVLMYYTFVLNYC